MMHGCCDMYRDPRHADPYLPPFQRIILSSPPEIPSTSYLAPHRVSSLLEIDKERDRYITCAVPAHYKVALASALALV